MLNSISRMALIVALAMPGVAYAQSTASVDEDEIVVTAQRREERLQDVPLSVSAVSGEGLERAGIVDTRQLTQTMPNLVFSRASTTFQPTIRGVGTRNANVGDESNVSVYVDSVYQPVPASLNFDLLNVTRVEVLRGPQGTLFGRNSTGGLINIITPDPGHDASGRLVGRVGNFGEKSFQFYGTTGITDSLAVDLALQIYDDDGYIRDMVRGGYVGDREALSARTKLLFEPNDFFRAVLAATYTDVNDNSSSNGQPFRGNTVARATPPVPFIPTRPWESALDQVLYTSTLTKSLSLQTRFRFNGFDIETTSAVQGNDARSETDNDHTTRVIARSEVDQSTDNFSNELRILSTTDGALSWIAGVYLYEAVARGEPLRSLSNGVQTSILFSEQNTESWAVFGEANLNLSDRWRVIGGVRYTEEERDYEARNATTTTVPRQYGEFDALTYRLSLQYRFADDGNVYFTYARGFKSGVFNGFAGTVPAAAITRPEWIDSYEIGVKADPTSWLRLSAAAFHYDYSDIQQSARSSTSSLVLLFNAASATVDGAELELSLRPIDNLEVRAYATYLDAIYDSFPTAQVFQPNPSGGNTAVSPFDASGKRMIRAPEYTLGVNFNYIHQTSVGDFALSGNVFHSGSYYWDFENRIEQPSYTLISGELSWEPADSWRIALWGRNLSNEVVYSNVLTAAQGDVAGFERPRSYGVSLAWSF